MPCHINSAILPPGWVRNLDGHPTPQLVLYPDEEIINLSDIAMIKENWKQHLISWKDLQLCYRTLQEQQKPKMGSDYIDTFTQGNTLCFISNNRKLKRHLTTKEQHRKITKYLLQSYDSTSICKVPNYAQSSAYLKNIHTRKLHF